MNTNRYSLNELCRILNVSRSGYIYWLNHYESSTEKKAEFLREVITVYAEFKGIYGAKKLRNELADKGIICSRQAVSRALRILGLKSIVITHFKRRTNTIKEGEKALIVNLIKGLEVTRINQVWTTDITYIQTKDEGTFFLITFIDLYSKRVLAWGLKEKQRSEDIIEVLKVAIEIRKPEAGLIIHSDKGSQYRSREYRNFLSQNNIIPSYTSLNHSCDENAAQESFHSLLKKECVYQRTLHTYSEAFQCISDYIDNFYNPVRQHSAISFLSPANFEASLPFPPISLSDF